MDEKILSPALRFTTSDVAASGANLYPMLLTDGPNGVISLGSPIKLAHDKGATILDFRKNLGAGMRPLCGCDEESYSAYGH